MLDQATKFAYFKVLSTIVPEETLQVLKDSDGEDYRRYDEEIITKCLLSYLELSGYEADTRLDGSYVSVMLGSVLDNLGIGLERDK